MLRWEVTSADQLLSEEEVRRHLKLLPDDTDNLSDLIQAAREYCENYTGESYGSETVEVDVDAAQIVELPRTPATGITSITANGETVTDYTFNAGFGIVTFGTELGNVHIVYTAGKTLPQTVKQAMLSLIGHWHTNREAVVVGAIATVEPSIGAKELLRQYKGWWF